MRAVRSARETTWQRRYSALSNGLVRRCHCRPIVQVTTRCDQDRLRDIHRREKDNELEHERAFDFDTYRTLIRLIRLAVLMIDELRR
jgi:hypothetical protein